MRAVFHLLTILENVVEPELTSTCRIRLLNCRTPSSEARKNACAVRSFVCSFVKFQTASLSENYLPLSVRILGRIRFSKPHMENRSCGLSLEYTETEVSSHSMVVSGWGRLCLTFQNTARPRSTLRLMRRVRQSPGQQCLLLYPMTLLFTGSRFALRYREVRSRDSSAANRKRIGILST